MLAEKGQSPTKHARVYQLHFHLKGGSLQFPKNKTLFGQNVAVSKLDNSTLEHEDAHPWFENH